MIHCWLLRFVTFLLLLLMTGCGGGREDDHGAPYNLGGFQQQPDANITARLAALLPQESDQDQDFIPDSEEQKLGLDPNNPDENSNGIPDGLEGDPFFPLQWYIRNERNQNICTTSSVQTIAGNDLHLLALYHYTLGSTHHPMIIQVVDGGVDTLHEDLDISPVFSLNSITGTRDPAPVQGISQDPVQCFYRGHGTAVSGIIAARGFNQLGIRGIAPLATIAGSNWLESEEISTLAPVWYNDDTAHEISISTNSWGKKFLQDKSYETIMAQASLKGRGGKGRLFVFACGNDRETHGNANLSYLINNPYAIAVAALNHRDQYASYSSPGSNILVSAYGGEHYYTAPTIMTTFSSSLAMTRDELQGRKGPITVDEDSGRDYTYGMNGTSAAAPMVSGALALVLDLCPDLGWRDVRWLIAKHATPVDINSTGWQQNAAGLWHSNDYGFGKINSAGMAAECLDPAYHILPPQKYLKITQKHLHLSIPDNNQTIRHTITVTKDMMIEWVGLTLAIDHPYAGDLEITLISPSGSTSQLITPNFIKSNAYREGFRLATVSLTGESARGRWQVLITDRLQDDNGTLNALTLEIKGHEKP